MKAKEPIDVGHDVGDLLIAWRPNIKRSGKDVSAAIMHALEHYSIEREGSEESGLSAIIHYLSKDLEARYRSI